MPDKEEGGGGSMYDKLNNHEDRIIVLEKTDVEIIKQIKEMQSNYTNLENTIWKTSQSTQEVFRDTINKQWELINERDKSKDADRQRQHELMVGKQSIAASNWSKAWELSGKFFAAGGIGYLIFEAFFNK